MDARTTDEKTDMMDVTGASQLLQNTKDVLMNLLRADKAADREQEKAVRDYNKAVAEGRVAAGHPPKKKCVKCNSNHIVAIKAAVNYIDRRNKIQQMLDDNDKAIELYHKIDSIAKLLQMEDDELWGELKETVLRCAPVEPVLHKEIAGLVAFTCPICHGHSMLSHGTAFYHCPKCGQKLFDYKENHWGIAPKMDEKEIINKLEEEDRKTAPTYAAIPDNWIIGEEYDLMLELPVKGATAVTYATKKCRCTLVGKYPRTMLFEYEMNGVKMRKALNLMDVKMAI